MTKHTHNQVDLGAFQQAEDLLRKRTGGRAEMRARRLLDFFVTRVELSIYNLVQERARR